MTSFAVGASLPLRIGHSLNGNVETAFENLWRGMKKTALYLVTPLVVALTIKSILIYSSEGVLGYREAVFSREGAPSVLFGSAMLEGLYWLVIQPFIWVFLFFGVAKSFRDRRAYWTLPALLVLLDSVMRLGRMGPYGLVVIALLSAYFVRSHKSASSAIARRLLAAIAICTVAAALLGISVARDDSGRMTVADHLVQWGVVYHGVGFVILDQELRRTDGLLQTELTLGRSAVSGLERYVVLALRRFDRSLTPMGSTTGTYLDEFRPIGSAGPEYPLMANAFATSLFSLYLDAREVGVFLGSFGFGVLLGMVFRTWKAHGSVADCALLVGLTVGGWMSVFQSQLDNPRYWLLFVTWVLLYTVAIRRPQVPVRSRVT